MFSRGLQLQVELPLLLRLTRFAAGVPNSVVYNLKTEDSNQLMFNTFIRNDQLAGIPLPIDASYTSKDLNKPMHLATLNNANAGTFKLKVTDQTGADAVFSDAAFWFYFSTGANDSDFNG